MLRKNREFRPEAAPLEAKILLSLGVQAPLDSGPPVEVQVLAATKSPQAVNTLAGRYGYRQDNRIADVPVNARLDATGQVKGLGTVRLAGDLQMGGLRATDQDVTGTIRLTNARGSITLRVQGTGGNGQIPGATFKLSATVVKGTGAYAALRRTGPLTLQLGPNAVGDQSGNVTRANGTIKAVVGIDLSSSPMP